MRISDWSSDVCSSDLASCRPRWSSSSSKSTPLLPFASSEALELDGHRRAPRFGLAGKDPALGQLVVGQHVVDPHLHGALLAQRHAGGAVTGPARVGRDDAGPWRLAQNRDAGPGVAQARAAPNKTSLLTGHPSCA